MIRSSSYEKRQPKNSEFSADIMQITFPNKGLSNILTQSFEECVVVNICHFILPIWWWVISRTWQFWVWSVYSFNLFLCTKFFFHFFLFHLKKPIGIDLDNLQRLRVKIFPTLFFCSMKMPQKHSCCSKNKVNLLKFSQQCNWAVNSIFQPLSVHSMKLHTIIIKFMLPQNKSIFTKK